MPKINQEEYEVLKELDDKWKWIARDEHSASVEIFQAKPYKVGTVWMWEGYTYIDDIEDTKLFQFIQWEDEEPHNIAELIEEYEKDYKGSWEHAIEFSGEVFGESEETEVKKLKSVITEFSQESQVVNSWEGSFTGGYLSSIGFAEVEISSESPLDRGKYLGKEVTIIVGDDEPEALSQELPVIPKLVADYIDDRKKVNFPLYQAIRIVREDSRFEHSHLREWLWTNKGQETFARAWLDGYEVAEEREQKYYVDLETAAYVAKWDGNGQVDIYTDGISGSDEFEFYLTEQEIKDYDERFWPFVVKVEELEE